MRIADGAKRYGARPKGNRALLRDAPVHRQCLRQFLYEHRGMPLRPASGRTFSARGRERLADASSLPTGFASGVRYREEELRRSFFSARFVRTLDALGYTRFRHWRVYGEEALAKREATLWLGTESLTLEYGGQTLSRYDVEFATGNEELRALMRPRLFETSYVLPQL